MNKTEIITHIANKYNIERYILAEIIPEIFNFISHKVEAGESVNIKNFGTFFLKEKAQELKYHPIKKEKIIVPAKKLMVFRPTRKGFLVINEES